jgi:4-hydroxy-tetrahydrodipicolinate synthase
MVTPFAEDLSVDLDAAAALASHLVESGNDGIVVTGTTGESPTLSLSERADLYRVVKQTVGGRAVVIAGTGTNDTAHSIEYSRAAEKAGVDGLLLVTPYYNNPPQEALYRHFKAIAEATALPAMLYNVPSRTVRNIEAATTLRLARDVENITSVKEASGNLGQISTILAGAPEGFAVYSGDDMATLPMLAMGAVGVVSVAAHVVGPQMRAMITEFLAGEVARAAEWHQRLTPVFHALFCTTNPIPLKAALDHLGLPGGGRLRPPLIEATEAERRQVVEALAALGVIPQ